MQSPEPENRKILNVPDTASLEGAATEWFFRRDRGFSAVEDAEFARWLGQDEDRRRIFSEIERSWSAFGRLGDEVRRRDDVLAGSQVSGARRMQTERGESWSGRDNPSYDRKEGGSNKVIWFPAAVFAIAAAAVVGLFVWQRPVGLETAVVETIAASRDAVRAVSLPDGSSVQLNTESVIEIRFTETERGIRLVKGEAHFAVAKNPRQPFVVTVGSVAVRAIGTAFNVKLRRDALEVLVVEGKVQVSPQVGGSIEGGANTEPSVVAMAGGSAAAQTLLTAGEKVVIPMGSAAAPAALAVLPVPAVEMEQALGWQRRRLEYTDAPLAEIVADFNRYNAHKLVIDDTRLAGRRFGATFPVDDTEALVRMLESTAGVVAERREKATVLRLKVGESSQR